MPGPTAGGVRLSSSRTVRLGCRCGPAPAAVLLTPRKRSWLESIATGAARRQPRRAGRDHRQCLQRGGDGDAGAPDVGDAAHVRGVGQIGDLQGTSVREQLPAGGAAVGLHDV